MEKNIQRMHRGVVSVLVASMALGIGILSYNIFEKNDELEIIKKDISKQSGIIEKHERTLEEYQLKIGQMDEKNVKLNKQRQKLLKQIEEYKENEKKYSEEIKLLKKKIEAKELKAKELKVKQNLESLKKKESTKTSVNKSAKINNSASTEQFSLTCYVSNCKGCSGVTSTGLDVRNTIYHNGMRIVSTDRNVIPMGSILEISVGGRTFKAQALDVGGAIKGHKMDLLVSNVSEAMAFGRQTASVKIVRRGW